MSQDYPIKLRDSITTRILFVVFIFYFLVTITLTLIHMYVEYSSTYNRVFGRLKLMENTFNPALAGALWSVNDGLINSTVQGMLQNPILKGVKIEDPKQLKLIRSAGKISDEHGRNITKSDGAAVDVQNDNSFPFKMFYYRFDIVYRDEGRDMSLGVCTLYSDISVVLNEVQLGFILIVITAVIKTIVFWFIYLFVSWMMLSKPLSRLTQAVRQVNLDNLEHLQFDIQTEGRNELKILEDSFRFMINKLLLARQRLETNINISKRFSNEGRKISSCMDFKKLADQIKQSFSEIAGRDICPQVELLRLSGIPWQLPKTTPTAMLSTVAVKLPEHQTPLEDIKELDVRDTRNSDLIGKVTFLDFRNREEEELLLPLFKALTVNISNTMKNISMVQELKQKAFDLQESNQRLSRLDRLKDEFLANTSHELRTPLNGIIGIAETLVDGIVGSLNKMQKRQLTMIIWSSRALLNLINDILDYSKISNKVLRLDLCDLSFYHVIDIVLTFFTPLIEKKGLKLEKNIPKDLPSIKADENRLQQILFNLLGNALKFTHQGKISITVTHENGFIRISVGDTGIGISKENQKRIFDPFEQFFDQEMKKFGGTGLGLSISRQLVDLHGGTINVESMEGIGSIFSFTIPISKEPADKIKSSEKLSSTALRLFDIKSRFLPEIKNEAPIAFEEKRDEVVLVVDDEALNLEVVKNHLHMKGFRVLTAEDGLQALKVIEQESPDLVLLDLMMPVLNGYDTCRKIRETYDFITLPVIILTARNQIRDLVEGFRLGANDYILKPFFKEELLARVDIHLEAKKAVQRLKEVRNLELEVQQRKQAEKELKISQKRLLRILDVAESALITLNESLKIIFFNQGAEELFGYNSDEITGKHLQLVLTQDSIKKTSGILSTWDETERQNSFIPHYLTIKKKDGVEVNLPGTLSILKLKKEVIYTIMLSTPAILKRGKTAHVESSISLFNAGGFVWEEGKAKRDCLKEHAYNEALNEVGAMLTHENRSFLQDLRYFGTFFENIPSRLRMKDGGLKLRETISDIMRYSLAYWELSGDKNKVDLAEESRIWSVALDAGTYRTRTMDKYLKPETLPKNPKWKDVFKTAIYVLENSPSQEPQKTQLIASIEKFFLLYERESRG